MTQQPTTDVGDEFPQDNGAETMAKGGAAVAQSANKNQGNKNQPANASNKGKPGKPAANSEEADEKPTVPDGTKQKYTLGSGKVIEGVFAEGKLCCPTCSKRLATSGASSAVRKQRAAERIPKIQERGKEMFAHFKQLMTKEAERAGLEAPSDEDILAMLAGGAG